MSGQGSAPSVRMTRRVTFSSGHRYWNPTLTVDENRLLFGQWASPYNHGHNYVLEVTVAGRIDPRTAMIVNIKTIDEILQDLIVSRFDQKSINDEIDDFHSRAPSLENLLLHIGGVLSSGVLPEEAKLIGLRLHELESLYGDYFEQDGEWIMTLTRTYEFAASHRLHVPAMSDKENLELFGKCNNAAGHGHNYLLEVTVLGEPDPKTGMMVDLGKLDAVVEELVVDRYDHKHLNVDIPEFQQRTPTSEVIADEIFKRLDGNLPATLFRVRLHETARNIFEVLRS
jgi:6-pyruvoyltetrahydropterin/6-carboxytetrahydropterin synthase